MASSQARATVASDRRSIKHRGNEDLQKWTAARCNRLLRQISSRVAHLRQLVTEAADSNRSRKRGAATPNEAQPEKKRVRHTYGGRKARTDVLSERDGNTSTPPRVMRTLGAMRPHMLSSPAALCCPTPIRPITQHRPTLPLDTDVDEACFSRPVKPTKDVSSTISRSSPPPSYDVGPEHLKTYQAITIWLEKLLQLTVEKQNEPSRKSLLGMCLSKIPKCLAEIEAYDRQKAEAEGQGSMWQGGEAVSAMYSQLDAFGTSEEGWKPFKLLVRSHVVQILSRAAEEGLFAPGFVANMAKVCARSACTAEAEQLLSICQRIEEHDDQSDRGDSPRSQQVCNRTLVGLCAGQEAAPAFLSSLGRAISARQLPVTDIAPKYRSAVWKSSFAAMANPSGSWLGSSLLIPALESLATSDENGPWASQERKEKMLTSLAAGISGAAITALTQQDRRRHIYILEAAISNLMSKRGRSRKAQHSGIFLLLLARQLVLQADTSVSFKILQTQGIADLNSIIPRSTEQALYRQTVALMCSVAHACSRTTGKPSHEVLENLRAALHELPLPVWFAEGLRSEGTFVLANKTRDLRDLAMAEALSETQKSVSSRPASSTMFSGWRWEAGISEWVLPSPQTRAGTRESLQIQGPDEKSDIIPTRSSKILLQRGLEPGHGQAELRPGREAVRTTNGGEVVKEAVQSHAFATETSTDTSSMKGAPRQKMLHVMRTCVAANRATVAKRRPGVVSNNWLRSRPCNGDERKGRGACAQDVGDNDQRGRVLTTRSRQTAARSKDEVLARRSCGAGQFKARAEIRDGSRDGVTTAAHGVDLMLARSVATARKCDTRNDQKLARRRRRSTTAVPARSLACSEVESMRKTEERRRTTVSLSSLAMCPGSDNWDELM